MKISKLLLGFFITTSFISCVFAFSGQSTRPMLADGATVPQPVFLFAEGCDIFTIRLDGKN